MGGSTRGDPLTAGERARLDALSSARSLSDLVGLTDRASEHDAYFAAKQEWADLQETVIAARPPVEGFPGDAVDFEDRTVTVHGITHTGTETEGKFLRTYVAQWIGAGEAVYCEQGIRPMYFTDHPTVCEMDDYRWAMIQSDRLGVDSHLRDLASHPAGANGATDRFDGLLENIDAVASTFRDATFALVDSGSDVYGDEFAAALGDVATTFLTSHEDRATGNDFESFQKSRVAATDPDHLGELQDYYRKTFLPQPVEREWLRRHDRELELFTHARNERMADYALYHAEAERDVHVIVGAAHQPGVRYYLERHRDGTRNLEGFELTG